MESIKKSLTCMDLLKKFVIGGRKKIYLLLVVYYIVWDGLLDVRPQVSYISPIFWQKLVTVKNIAMKIFPQKRLDDFKM